MRISLWLTFLLLAGCGGADEQDAAQTATAAVAADDRIECALGGATYFTKDCAVEQDGDGAADLTIRHPDGGFRKLQITSDGRGVIAADGAARADVQVIADKRIEVTVDGDRYRLPATIKSR